VTYHPRTRNRVRQDGALGLWDATAMAVGGMIGGGIFTVLGVAIALAGHLAAGCFVLGMLLAGATARSYAGVGARAGRSGGPFEHLREQGHAQLAGLLLWLLVLGYVVVMGVYSFTFGRYAAEALGAPVSVARVLSVAVVVAFLAVNLRGVVLSSPTEDVIVALKLAILATIAIVGVSRFSPHRLTPMADRGWGGLLLGAATVFVAYEGFELITYDRDDMDDPDVTMPRALYVSVAIVAAIYVTVTVGSQMLTPDATIVAQREVAFAAVGDAALGSIGRWLAIAGAILATSSAINATIFSAARLIRDAAGSGELPAAFAAQRNGEPIVALVAISIGGTAMAMLPGLTEVIAFGSASFLAIYTLVNVLEVRMATRARDRAIAAAAATGCVGAIVALVVELARDDPGALAFLIAGAAALGAGRVAFARRHVGPNDPGGVRPAAGRSLLR